MVLAALLLGACSAAMRAENWLGKLSHVCAEWLLGRGLCHEDMIAFAGYSFVCLFIFLRNVKLMLDEKPNKTIFKWQFHILFCAGTDIKEQQRVLTD